jgi:hypothetical protein
MQIVALWIAAAISSALIASGNGWPRQTHALLAKGLLNHSCGAT